MDVHGTEGALGTYAVLALTFQTQLFSGKESAQNSVRQIENSTQKRIPDKARVCSTFVSAISRGDDAADG